MLIVSIYNVIALIFYGSLLYFSVTGTIRDPFNLWVQCISMGGIGGVVYCLRGVYLNACVRNAWDNKWKPWYFIRPIISGVCGLIACIFIQAGLIILESSKAENATEYAFLTISFIAGLNVDKFLARIENIGKSAFGIENSRTTQSSEDNQ